MKILGRLGVALSLVVCIAALALGAWPGLLDDLITGMVVLTFVGTIMLAPAIALASLVAIGVCVWRRRLPFRGFGLKRLPWKHAGIALGMLMATGVLLVFHVPARLAFASAQPKFELLLAQAPMREGGGVALNQKVGMYRVDEYAADERGGVYFRVYRSKIPLGPDTLSFGFVHKPNEQGSPFGAASYTLFPLRGDWYAFEASDDWH